VSILSDVIICYLSITLQNELDKLVKNE